MRLTRFLKLAGTFFVLTCCQTYSYALTITDLQGKKLRIDYSDNNEWKKSKVMLKKDLTSTAPDIQIRIKHRGTVGGSIIQDLVRTAPSSIEEINDKMYKLKYHFILDQQAHEIHITFVKLPGSQKLFDFYHYEIKHSPGPVSGHCHSNDEGNTSDCAGSHESNDGGGRPD